MLENCDLTASTMPTFTKSATFAKNAWNIGIAFSSWTTMESLIQPTFISGSMFL